MGGLIRRKAPINVGEDTYLHDILPGGMLSSSALGSNSLLRGGLLSGGLGGGLRLGGGLLLVFGGPASARASRGLLLDDLFSLRRDNRSFSSRRGHCSSELLSWGAQGLWWLGARQGVSGTRCGGRGKKPCVIYMAGQIRFNGKRSATRSRDPVDLSWTIHVTIVRYSCGARATPTPTASPSIVSYIARRDGFSFPFCPPLTSSRPLAPVLFQTLSLSR